MAADRDTIFQALLARLSEKVTKLASPVNDRMRHWSSTPPSEQPCLSVVKGPERRIGDFDKPPIWDLTATLYLYVHAQNLVDVSPQRRMNQILTQIEAAFEGEGEGGYSPSGGQFATTLGGLVKYARIEGEIMTDEGTLDDQTVAVIRVVMRTTA